ncbi:NACHT domain-containing protein [Streptomyces sp. NPDC013953]|uniref:NACHT domain-containing protein n=1 Tax=Streptomyces sp. NPDC013953 TaxID=3364868 RepID=UPI0036F5C506
MRRLEHGCVGVWYLLLVFLGVGAALLLSWHFNLGTAATVGTLITVLLAVPSLYLAWAAFRQDHTEASVVDLQTAADGLAQAVKKQWDDEAQLRRVNDPYPLPVGWRAAEDDLAEPWPLLTELARAWPGGPPGDPALWPHHATGLAGADAQIAEVFTDRVPTRRLVILGEPGAGKSVLLIRLLQDLIERRTGDSPVPVVFSLASWNARQPLKTWLAEQLRRTYPGLRSPAPTPVTIAGGPGDLAQALLDAGRILPLIDGFDELPPALHPMALDALNRALPAKQPLVLASRAAPYRDALAHPGTTVRLNGAAAIQLLPLTPDAAATYLRRDAGGPEAPAAGRWDAVAARLGTDTPVGHALSTPLGLFLARTIYNPRPHSAPKPSAPHPDELCDTTAFPDRATVDTHLFQAFVPAAYAPDSPHPPRWSTAQANRAFVFLARFLQYQRAGSPDLAWWELPQAIPPHTRRLTMVMPVVLGVGFVVAIPIGLAAGLVNGLLLGLLAGLVNGILVEERAGSAAPRFPRLHWSFSRLGLLAGLLGGILFWFQSGIVLGILVGLASVIMFEFGRQLRRTQEEPALTTITGPITRLSLDRRNFITVGLTGGIAMGLVCGFSVGLTGGGFTAGLTGGIAVGIAYGFGVGLRWAAWPHFVMAWAYLVVSRRLPRNLMAFLQDAHEHRGVLRQVGAVYQFRHIDLQRHLAQQQT